MSAPTPSQSGETPPPVQQLSLPGAEEMFAAVGLESLPMGASDMTSKQLRFAIEYLRCGIATQAARRAGIDETGATKMLKKPAVLKFVEAAVKPVAQNGDQLVRRAWERSVSLHDELMTIRAREARSADDHRRESQLMLQLTRNDLLLAALLNRLGIKLTGEISVNTPTSGGDFMVIPPDSLAGFAAARQEVAASNRLAKAQAGGVN